MGGASAQPPVTVLRSSLRYLHVAGLIAAPLKGGADRGRCPGSIAAAGGGAEVVAASSAS